MNDRLSVDSSAIVAIVNREPEARSLAAALVDVEAVVGWPTILEVRLWLARRPSHTTLWLDHFLARRSTKLVPFDGAHERLATAANAAFGKGRHAANLNFGDCMAYAIAMRENLPLLFKGADFGQTDVVVHPASVALGG